MAAIKTKYALYLNHELAKIFNQMAACYRYQGNEERFRAIAYENAAKTLSNMSESIELFGNDIKKLDELKGIGSHIAAKIIEFNNTGKIQTFEFLKKKVPYDLFSLMEIEGIGPSTIRNLHENLSVSTIKELQEKLKDSTLYYLKGVTRNNLEKIKKELKITTAKSERIPFSKAKQLALKLLEFINDINHVKKATIAGSIRRKKETIGDIDIIVASDENQQSKVIEEISKNEMIKRILLKGDSKISVKLKEKDFQADIRVVDIQEYGAALLYFTGSKEHNIELRKIARSKGFKLNEYGLFTIEGNKKVAGETEEEIYKSIGIKYIEPSFRTGSNEINENRI